MLFYSVALLVNESRSGGSKGTPSDETYIYAPEFLDRVKIDNLLQQIVPVLALSDNTC